MAAKICPLQKSVVKLGTTLFLVVLVLTLTTYGSLYFIRQQDQTKSPLTCGQFDSNRTRVKVPKYFVRPVDYWSSSPSYSENPIDPRYNMIGPVKGLRQHEKNLGHCLSNVTLSILMSRDMTHVDVF